MCLHSEGGGYNAKHRRGTFKIVFQLSEEFLFNVRVKDAERRDDLENHVHEDILQCRLDEVTDDLAQLVANMDVEVDQTLFGSLEDSLEM
ncbi:hypothetical protein EYF80_022303 [Liparis tanakae]|uniref:Uncharacterized protein n=1 Tax=Liparis tanakae TaxID=230148 RepID=A0A4Z2HP01_9TELE|nr:hypothetical protein EYF80_022303 [Liparis tanakae]